MAVPGLQCCLQACSSRGGWWGRGGWGLLFVAVQGLLIAVVSPVSSSRRMSFITYDTQAQKLRLLGSRARTSLVAPQHMGPS